MAPLSKSDMGRERRDETILKISETLGKISLKSPKTQEEQSTYDISDDESTSTLENCTKIIEKGPIKPDRWHHNRPEPFARNQTSGVSQFFNYEEENIINNIINQNFGGNPDYSLQFNDFSHIFDNNGGSGYDFDHSISGNTSDETTNYLELPNIPVTIENFPQTTSNTAEKQLSNYIDRNKQLKQTIWIKVNVEPEQKLIALLRKKVAAARFNHLELNFIYAIVIRLLKEEGRTLLREFFATDEGVLFKIALKGNTLLVDFILEVYQNLGIDFNQVNVLEQIVNHSQIDLCEIFEHLLQKTFDNKPSVNMFDVNSRNYAGESILLIVLRNMLNNKGNPEINAKYFEMVVRRGPDVNYVTPEGKYILEQAIAWGCPENIIQRIRMLYPPINQINYNDNYNFNEYIL